MTEHVAIVDAQRHEPKHASTAVANTVNKSNGDGTTKYDFVNWSEVAGKPSSTAYTQSIYAASTAASQAPASTNTPLQIEFGSGASNTDVTLSSSGTVTFNTAGYYLVQADFSYGRTSTTGTVYLFTRAVYNGAQLKGAKAVILSPNLQTEAGSHIYTINASAGDSLVFQLVRDSAGANDGALLLNSTTTSGWTGAPSAAITISKFTGLV